MYCQKCGKELENDSRYCIYCGYTLERRFKQRKIIKVILICVGLLVLVGGIFIGYLISQNKENVISSNVNEQESADEKSQKIGSNKLDSETDEDAIVNENEENEAVSQYVFDPYDLNDTNGLTAVKEEDVNTLLQKYLYGTWQGTVGEDLQYYDNFVVNEDTIGEHEYSLYSVYESESAGIIVFYQYKESDDIYMLQTAGNYILDGHSYCNESMCDSFTDFQYEYMFLEKCTAVNDYEYEEIGEYHICEVYEQTRGLCVDEIRKAYQSGNGNYVYCEFDDFDNVQYSYSYENAGEIAYTFIFRVCTYQITKQFDGRWHAVTAVVIENLETGRVYLSDINV